MIGRYLYKLLEDKLFKGKTLSYLSGQNAMTITGDG